MLVLATDKLAFCFRGEPLATGKLDMIEQLWFKTGLFENSTVFGSDADALAAEVDRGVFEMLPFLAYKPVIRKEVVAGTKKAKISSQS